MAVDGNVALSAGADQRSAELDLGRVIDVVEVDAVVVADEEVVADKGEVGVDRAGVDRGTAAAAASRPRCAGRWSGRRRGWRGVGVGRESRRLLEAGDFLQSEDRLAGVEQAGLEANAGIVRAGARVGIDARAAKPWWGRVAAPFARCRARVQRGMLRMRSRRENGRNIVLGSFLLLVKHAAHDFDFCALGVLDVGGEVEQDGVLTRAGGVEKVVHHGECAAMVLDHSGKEEVVELRAPGFGRGRPSVRA